MRQRQNGYNNSSSNSSDSMYARGGSGGLGSRDIEGGIGGGGGRRFNDTNAGILEQQNNERIYELSEQVARLKVCV
jgi:hypothetical protein